MKKLISIFTLLFIYSLSVFAGPFGLDMGMTIEDALKKVENILSEPEILVETVENEVCEKEPEVEDKTPQTENMDAKQEETPRTETIVFER